MIASRLLVNTIRMFAVASISLFVSACGGGGGGGAAAVPASPAATVPPPPASPPPPPANSPPVSDAGNDLVVQGGDIVYLVGSGSDADGESLQYVWEQITGPTVSVENATSTTSNFTAPLIEGGASLDFELSVSDGKMTATDDVNVFASSEFVGCVPTEPPIGLGLDPFYKKYCDAMGIAIVSSEKVPDRALEWVRYQALRMVQKRNDIHQVMIGFGGRIAVMATSEEITDLPEFVDLGDDEEGRCANCGRGLGGGVGRPVTITAEENVLCYVSDGYRESVFGHEYGHTMVSNMGIASFDSNFDSRIEAAYNAAIAAGKYQGVWASKNHYEYWAEGVQKFFEFDFVDPDYPNIPYSRDELAQYDPGIYELLLEIYPEIDIVRCPTD